MEIEVVGKLLQSYLYDDLPKRMLDASVFGGIAAGAWTLITGRARRRELGAFLKTHQEYVKRLKRVVEIIRSKGSAQSLRDLDRRQMYSKHEFLKGQQLLLFAKLGEPDQKNLLEYFDRIERITRTFDFNVPDVMVQNGPLVYETLNRFRNNIAILFKPNTGEGAATEEPMEQACLPLQRIVWSVYLFPIVRQPRVSMDDARSIDVALKEISATFSKSTASVEPTDWGEAVLRPA